MVACGAAAKLELQRRADANSDDASSTEGPLDSDDDAITVEEASAETARATRTAGA